MLVQQRDGGAEDGLELGFGGAASASLSGSSVVEKNLNRLTIFTALIWAMRSGVDMIQPTFQPVTENVLPADEIDTSRSRAASTPASTHS